MSKETNELLKQMAASLKSIDERLGLLISRNPICARGIVDPVLGLQDLVIQQKSFAEDWFESMKIDEEMLSSASQGDEELRRIFKRFWGIAPFEEVPEGYERSFSKVSKQLGELGLDKNPSRRNKQIRDRILEGSEKRGWDIKGNPTLRGIVANHKPRSIRFVDHDTIFLFTRFFYDLLKQSSEDA